MCFNLTFTHNFAYSYVENNFKPIIPVSFSYKEREYSYPMYIDSGSSYTALPPEHAVAFGIEDITALTEKWGHGIGGGTHYRILEGVKIIIVEKEIELAAPICFVDNMRNMEFGILGREVIFSHLKIAFKECDGPYIYMAMEKKS